jgi:hypothetical protein
MQLYAASHQWRNRPADERFTSLIDMQEHFDRIRAESRQCVSSTSRLVRAHRIGRQVHQGDEGNQAGPLDQQPLVQRHERHALHVAA